jgi:hypothetical protein
MYVRHFAKKHAFVHDIGEEVLANADLVVHEFDVVHDQRDGRLPRRLARAALQLVPIMPDRDDRFNRVARVDDRAGSLEACSAKPALRSRSAGANVSTISENSSRTTDCT